MQDGLIKVPISRVEPNRSQPRQTFDETSLQSLAESIAAYGLLQPLTVRAIDNGYYQIIAGERRWRACRMAGLQEVPVRVIQVDERTTQEIALVENLQREDLSPVEEALGYRQLTADYGMSISDVARAVGKDRASVSNMLRLLSLPKGVLQMLSDGRITPGHARALLPLPSEEMIVSMAEQIQAKQLSVRQVESLVSGVLKRSKAATKEENLTVNEVDYAAVFSRQLSEKLGRKVNIVDGQKKGRIIIEYYGADDRERLLTKLSSLEN